MNDSITNLVRTIVREEIEKAFKVERAARKHAAEIPPFTFDGHEPTWTSKQAAAFLGIARSTLYNKISLGQFPRPRKQGKLNAFIPSEVAEWRRQTLGLDQ